MRLRHAVDAIDVTDLLDRVARENMRVGAAEIVVDAEHIGTIECWPGGLRTGMTGGV